MDPPTRFFLCVLALGGTVRGADVPGLPKVADPRLEIELFAAAPDIVTPFGLTVDSDGRVFVVESHTHMRPDDYPGPHWDRLRVFEDSDGDGQADRSTTFHEGETWLMSAVVHFNGWIYAISRNELFRLRDTNADGRADQRETLARLETEADYPHNGFLSITLDSAGNVLWGLGQNYGAPYVLRGSDGRTLSSDRGDGGIFRCSQEGQQLTQLAVGFWNPCGLGFDAFGRLFTVDNDPGNRPPCRLIEVVPGGDFGYRRRALEPFIAWNGELPGTLPMITSTPEAPTAVLAYESDQLPEEYRGRLLVSSWSEYRIDSLALRTSGGSFTTEARPLVVGDDQFRPAGIAVAPDGSLFVSDWIERSYRVHGRGRVWRIRLKDASSPAGELGGARQRSLDAADRATREAVARELIQDGEKGIEALASYLQGSDNIRGQATAFAALVAAGAVDDAAAEKMLSHGAIELREQALRLLPAHRINSNEVSSPRLQAARLRRLADRQYQSLIIESLNSDDPFVRQAAALALRRSHSLDELLTLFRHPSSAVRHAAIIGIRERHPQYLTTILRGALDDPSDDVYFAAVEWIAQQELTAYRAALLEDLRTRARSAVMFEMLLAAVARIDGVLHEWTPARSGDWWKSHSAANDMAAELLSSPDSSPLLRRLALEFLPPDHAAVTLPRLEALSEQSRSDSDTQLAIIRAAAGLPESASFLQQLARDPAHAVNVRAEAVLGLDPQRPDDRKLLFDLACQAPAAVRHEALRSLRGAELQAGESERLATLADEHPALAPLVARLVAPPPADPPPRSHDTDQWLQKLERLEGAADRDAGQRIFFHPRGPGCYRCHRVDGRGHAVGPALQGPHGVAAFTPRKLVESILQPSKEIPLGYLTMQVVTQDGLVLSGVIQSEDEDQYELVDSAGQVIAVRREEIELLAPHDKSIMPDGLELQLTDAELRDLLAFLLEQR